MTVMNQKGIDAWNARVDEVIKSIPVSAERAAEIEETYSTLTDEQIERILNEYEA